MSNTLLDGVNETGKRVGILDSYNVGLLTSLTQSNIQRDIDLIVQLINEGIDELARDNQASLTMAESTISLVTNTREYALASNLITLTYPFVDRTNNQYLYEWAGTYNDFLLLDPQQTFTGLPQYSMISPETGNLRLDRAPDSTLNGHSYYYEYKKNLALVNASNAMPFNDEVFRAMVPAWAQLWRRERNKEFDQGLYQQSIGRAAYALRQLPRRRNYSPIASGSSKDAMPW